MQKLIIANWKMQKSHNESVSWCLEHAQELQNLIQYSSITFALCPSFTVLSQLPTLCNTNIIKIGAQDCGFKDIGPYTGDISVKSLQELGCSYCIIGHSERRLYHHESLQSVAQKAYLLIAYNITPIVCIGETAQEHINGSTISVIIEQLKPVAEKIRQHTDELYVAYEPVWAIGTGKIPENSQLETICQTLHVYIQEHYPELKLKILYGGSVTEQTLEQFKKISALDGFLLGKASLDFQTLKKIVVLYKELF